MISMILYFIQIGQALNINACGADDEDHGFENAFRDHTEIPSIFFSLDTSNYSLISKAEINSLWSQMLNDDKGSENVPEEAPDAPEEKTDMT